MSYLRAQVEEAFTISLAPVGSQSKAAMKSVIFQPQPVSREQLVEAAFRFEGLEYNQLETHVTYDELGLPSGHVNCFGLMLEIARVCGIFDGDSNLPPAIYGERPPTLARVLRMNFEEITQSPYLVNMGDLLCFKYFDLDLRHIHSHHVGLIVRATQHSEYFIHASKLRGRVVVERLDLLQLRRLETVHYLKNFLY